MVKKRLLMWAVVPMLAAVAYIGLNSFTEADESDDAIKGQILSGDLPCQAYSCWHQSGTRKLEYSITGAKKKECVTGQPSDRCRSRDEEDCSGGSCSSGYALPH